MNAMIHQLKPASTQQSDLPANDADLALRHVAEAIHRLNYAISRAVEAGMTIEVIRASRHHDARGHWGDQLVPVVRQDA
jgi:hypothetical protein